MTDQLPAFGVEIETVNQGRPAVSRAIASSVGDGKDPASFSEGYQIEDREGRSWSVVKDGSLLQGGAEIVTPVLKSEEDLDMLRDVLWRVRRLGASSSPGENCGIHVHVDMTSLEPDEVVRVGRLWCGLEKILRQLLTDPARRDTASEWSFETRKYVFAASKERQLDESYLQSLWYLTTGGEGDVSEKYDRSRYHSLNLHSYFYVNPVTRHRRYSAEFRIFDGTLDADKVLFYVWLCRNVVLRGSEGEEENPTTPLDLAMLCLRWGYQGADLHGVLGIMTQDRLADADDEVDRVWKKVEGLGREIVLLNDKLDDARRTSPGDRSLHDKISTQIYMKEAEHKNERERLLQIGHMRDRTKLSVRPEVDFDQPSTKVTWITGPDMVFEGMKLARSIFEDEDDAVGTVTLLGLVRHRESLSALDGTSLSLAKNIVLRTPDQWTLVEIMDKAFETALQEAMDKVRSAETIIQLHKRLRDLVDAYYYLVHEDLVDRDPDDPIFVDEKETYLDLIPLKLKQKKPGANIAVSPAGTKAIRYAQNPAGRSHFTLIDLSTSKSAP